MHLWMSSLNKVSNPIHLKQSKVFPPPDYLFPCPVGQGFPRADHVSENQCRVGIQYVCLFCSPCFTDPCYSKSVFSLVFLLLLMCWKKAACNPCHPWSDLVLDKPLSPSSHFCILQQYPNIHSCFHPVCFLLMSEFSQESLVHPCRSPVPFSVSCPWGCSILEPERSSPRILTSSLATFFPLGPFPMILFRMIPDKIKVSSSHCPWLQFHLLPCFLHKMHWTPQSHTHYSHASPQPSHL